MHRIALMAAMTLLLGACLAASPDLGELEDGADSDTASATTTTTEDAGDDHTDDDHEGDDPAADSGSDTDAGEARQVEVVMTEHAFDPASFAVSAGETVQFVLKNEGVEEHEFRLTTMHAAAEHIASGHEGHDDEATEGEHGHDELLMVVPPGQTRFFSVTFEHAGEFDVVACLIPGHYENGMFAELNYENGDGEVAAPEARQVEVVMTEHAFDPASFAVSAGETVQFVLKNEGVEEHEFRLTTMHAAAEHIASGHEGHDDEATEGEHGHDELLMVVPPGQTRFFSVTFEHAGEFDVVACLIPGHYENGMFAELTYES